MHLLYLDDSGSIDDPNQKYFVLAGISVFERQTHWIETKLHEIATRFDSIPSFLLSQNALILREEQNMGFILKSNSCSLREWLKEHLAV